MRRSDREVSDKSEIFGIISRCDILRLGLCGEDGPYIVPMCFGALFGGGTFTLYLHSAAQGMKMELIRRGGRACFEADTGVKLVPGREACSFSFEYESVIGFGEVCEVSDTEEKKLALRLIMEHYVKGMEFSFTNGQADTVSVLRLRADSVTGKRSKAR